jgi:3-oxoacyl-[acyl-carrier protein] reductase
MNATRRTALVTGSGQNIGRAACEETAEAARACGVEAIVAMGDCGTAEGCNQIAGTGISRFGAIDVLVHNAAIRPTSPFLEMDEAEWRRVLDVNLNGAYWLARLCLPGMVRAGWGGWGLTKALAKEFGPRGVTVNIVSPGPIRSDHDDPAMTAHIEAMVSRIPRGSLGEPGEVAAAVSLLTSDRGAFINGQMIQVNGGAQT